MEKFNIQSFQAANILNFCVKCNLLTDIFFISYLLIHYN